MSRPDRPRDENALRPLFVAARIVLGGATVSEEELKRAANNGAFKITWRDGKSPETTIAEMRKFLQSCRVVPSADSIPLPSVYIVGFGQFVKIGFTASCVETRVAALFSNYPEPLTMYAVLKNCDLAVEKKLHRRFARLRAKGEWFRLRGNLHKWIKAGFPYP